MPFTPPPDVDALWAAYREQPTPDRRNRLAEAYLPLLRELAGRFRDHRPPPPDPDDLVMAGAVALLAAIDAFDPARDGPFERFCAARVWRTMADEVRQHRRRDVGREVGAVDRLADPAADEAAEAADTAAFARSMIPEADRPVFDRLLAGESRDEIAAALSLTPKQVEQVRRRARAALEGFFDPPADPVAGNRGTPSFRGGTPSNEPRPDPDPPADAVECSVYSPPRVPAGAVFQVRAFVHTPDQAADADRLAREYDEAATGRGRTELDEPVARGTALTLHLTFPGLAVTDPVQRVVWRGRPAYRTFDVEVLAGEAREVVCGRVAVARDGAPLGHVSFQVRVGAGAGAAPPAEPAARGLTRYRRGFASYASKDRDEVLRVMKLARLACDEVFLDVASLRTGQQWRPELERRIDECDLFLLFWSTAARESEWVTWEVRRASGRNKGDDGLPPAIYPVLLEGPPPPPAPAELSHLHFNDYYDYFRSRKE